MSEKDLDEKVEKLEELTDPNTVITVGGIKFTVAKLAILFGILSSAGGSLWAGFEFYKDYMDMKDKIQTYVAPDLSEFDKRLAVLEQNSEKIMDYTRDINTNLKSDIRRIEKIVEQVERDSKQTQREIDRDIREMRKETDNKIKQALDNPLAGK